MNKKIKFIEITVPDEIKEYRCPEAREISDDEELVLFCAECSTFNCPVAVFIFGEPEPEED